MRAVQVKEFGGPDVLVPAELPDPAAGPDQVVIGMGAADVIYLDTLLRAGLGGEYFPRRPPYVPGGGGAGRVLSVGAGVDPGWVGRRVLARSSGGYAERMIADLADLVEVPDDLGDPEAAAALHDGVTALELVRMAEIEPGQWVLVAAAAGGAGTWLVQLARDAGARVVAAARGARKLALARELGAEIAVDYSERGWTRRVREATGGPDAPDGGGVDGGGVDIAFDGAGGKLSPAVFDTVAPGGRFITYGTADAEFADIDPDVAEQRRVVVRNALEAGPLSQATVRERLTQALSLLAQRRIRPVIGATYPLERARDAHVSLAERATVGKSLLIIR